LPTQTKKITLDTAALFSGKFVGLLFGVIRLNYLATYLGVASFGTLNFATYFCSLFQVLFDLGISQLLIRELARDLSRSNEFVGRVLTLKIAIAFLAGMLVGITGFVSHFDRITNWAILLTTVVFAVNGVALVFLSAFQAHRRMTLVSLANLLNDLLLSIAIILVIQSSPNVVTVLLLSILIACVNLAILFTVYVRKVGMPELKADVNLWKSLLKESTPIAISSLGISTYTFIGPTILKYSRGDVEVGIYSAGYKLISILTLIPMTFSQVVYPIFSEFYTSAKEKLAKALSDSLRVVVIIIVPVAVGTVILAPKVFKLLYTEGFIPGVIVLQLTIVGNIFGYMDWVLYTFLLAVNRQIFGMKISVSFGLASIIVGLIAVPRLGFISLPFIQIAVELCLFVTQWWYLGKIGYRIFSITYLLKPAITSILMGAVLLILGKLNLFLILPIGIAVYFVGMYTLKGFGEQELELIRGVFLKLSIGRSRYES